jgi:phosphatidate phosphatase APP1
VYTFYDTQGNTVPPGAITVDVAAVFAKYFAATDAGGTFLLKASVPVTGDATQVAAVEVQVANSVAAARTARVKIP